MKKFIITIIVLSLILFAGFMFFSYSRESDPVDLSVMVVSSLKEPLTEIKNNFESQNKITLNYTFSSSQEITDNIISGDLTDFVILASQKNLNTLADENLINNETRENLVNNTLVVITSANSELEPGADISSWEIGSIAAGNPTNTSCGVYTQSYLKNSGLEDSVSSKLSYYNNVHSLLITVQQETVNAGIVFKSDAVNNDKIKIIEEFPASQEDTITYPMAAIEYKDTDEEIGKPEAIKTFEEYLKSDEAKQIFEKYGFSPA